MTGLPSFLCSNVLCGFSLPLDFTHAGRQLLYGKCVALCSSTSFAVGRWGSVKCGRLSSQRRLDRRHHLLHHFLLPEVPAHHSQPPDLHDPLLLYSLQVLNYASDYQTSLRPDKTQFRVRRRPDVQHEVAVVFSEVVAFVSVLVDDVTATFFKHYHMPHATQLLYAEQWFCDWRGRRLRQSVRRPPLSQSALVFLQDLEWGLLMLLSSIPPPWAMWSL